MNKTNSKLLKNIELLPKDHRPPIYKKHRNMFLCDGRRLESYIYKWWIEEIEAWWGIAIVSVFGGIVVMISVLSDGLADHLDSFLIGLSFFLIFFPVFLANLYFRFVKRPEPTTITLDRHTGQLHIPKCKGNPAFSVPFDDVELGVVRSGGRGIRKIVPYYVIKQFPAHIKKQRLYPAAILAKSTAQTTDAWAAICQFMDQSKPIPRHFFQSIQLHIDEQKYSRDSPDTVPAEIMAQEPLFDERTQMALDKEVWCVY